MDGADAGELQGGEHAMLKPLGHQALPVPVGVRPEPIVEARSLQAAAMRDLERIDLRLIERPGDRLNMIEAVLVANRVHPVAQRHILDIEFGRSGVEAHAAILSAIFSAVRSAAEVMMSRLPA